LIQSLRAQQPVSIILPLAKTEIYQIAKRKRYEQYRSRSETQQYKSQGNPQTIGSQKRP